MRVADRTTARNYLKYLHGAQAKYAETNERVASGKRFIKISDDVSAGSRVLRSRMDRYKAEKQLGNAKEANDELKVAEDSLRAINTLLTTIHEQKVVRVENDPTAEAGRNVIAGEVKSLMAEFIQYANAQFGKKYSFGGTNAITAPFTTDPASGRLLYNGVDVDTITLDPDTGKYMSGAEEVRMDQDIYFDVGLGIRMLEGPEVNPDTAFKLSYSGLEVFGFGKDDKGVSNNIYNILVDIQQNIADFDRDELEIHDTKLAGLMDGFRSNLTDIGTKTTFLDNMEDRLKEQVDRYTARIDDLMGIDDAEEATHQMLNDYVLKAVLQMGSRVLPLSLMDFLN